MWVLDDPSLLEYVAVVGEDSSPSHVPLRRRRLVGQTRGTIDGVFTWLVARKSSGVAAKLHGSISWHWNNTENSPTGAKLLVID